MTMTLVDLRTDAAAEAARLAMVRALTRRGDELARARCESEGPWVMVTRRSDLRRRLRERALLIWRVSCEDGDGRRVDSRIVGVWIPARMVSARPRGHLRVVSFLADVDALVRDTLDAVTREWRREATEAIHAFVATRVSRERAIADASQSISANAFQPGLFDRRAERGHIGHEAAAADTAQRATDRLAALERTATLASCAAELLLVLLP